jgi:DNA-directed RNA polymerase subunit RPC12/RpoP
MTMETIGEAWQLDWRITARCAFGNSDGMRSIRSCIYQYDLDLKTLIWTRGAAYPLSNLASRLKCPSCGSRRVALVFHMPREPQSRRASVAR